MSRSIINLIKTNPAVGWVRGDVAEIGDAQRELTDLRSQLELLKLNKRAQNEIGAIQKFKNGEDELDITFDMSLRKPFENGGEIEELTWTSAPTVDEIFGILVPILMDGANDQEIRDRLDSAILDKEWKAIGRDRVLKKLKLSKFSIQDISLSKVKIQFLALGLIEKSVRPGQATIYTLTANGERHMYETQAALRDKSE